MGEYRVWLRFKRNRPGLVGGLLLLLVAVAAITAPWLTPHSPTEANLVRAFGPPSKHHSLGTDELGRDLLSRLLYGGRVSLTMGIVSLGISLTVGTALGAMGAYCGGRLDNLIGRLMDMLLAFPPLLLAIAIISLAGPGLTNAMIAVGVVQIPVFARLIRGQILILKEQEFVIAARATGATDLNMLVVHLLPNCLSPLIVQSTFVFATAILSAAMLGFLGLGAQPPSPEWGAMLSKARGYLRVAPALSILPGLAIMMSVLSLNLLGDALRDALDPKLGAVRRQV